MSITRLPRALAEVATRQIYWRMPWLIARRQQRQQKRRASGDASARPTIPATVLRQEIDAAVAKSNGLLMVHSSLDSFAIQIEDGTLLPAAQAAMWLIEQLTESLGPAGTLCMPTHPLYLENPGFFYDKSQLVLEYRVDRTPASTGLLAEMFRRSKNVCRSRHPLSSLAARGPLAEELLHDNLNDRKPLAHGADSGYARFCQHAGGVLGLGVNLMKVLTILHTPEEVRDNTWPVKDFFVDRHFLVREGRDEAVRVTVRERRPEFVRSLMLSTVQRDLLERGILEETMCEGMRIDFTHSGRFLEFLQKRQQASTYPYMCPGLAAWGRAPQPPEPKK